MSTEINYHIPVMQDEVLQYLAPSAGQTFIDATTGTGGHSLAIIQRLMPGGRLYCIDRDAESLAVAKKRLLKFENNTTFINSNFTEISRIAKENNIEKVDGILFDLGISSFQLRLPERGFSFQEEGPLDMRMDRQGYLQASDLINNLNEEEISSLLKMFGQERWHRRIARAITQARQQEPIQTTFDLKEIVLHALPARFRRGHIHPATRTFQAVRIALNRELECIEKALEEAIALLSPGGKICVISFHSLEDRLAKLAFRNAAGREEVTVLTPKPLPASRNEIIKNPLSRSAKLRAAQKKGL